MTSDLPDVTTLQDEWQVLLSALDESGGALPMRRAVLAFAHELVLHTINTDAAYDEIGRDAASGGDPDRNVLWVALNYDRQTGLCLACQDASPEDKHACYAGPCVCICNGEDWDDL